MPSTCSVGGHLVPDHIRPAVAADVLGRFLGHELAVAVDVFHAGVPAIVQVPVINALADIVMVFGPVLMLTMVVFSGKGVELARNTG